jgi:hypothetical protein
MGDRGSGGGALCLCAVHRRGAALATTDIFPKPHQNPTKTPPNRSAENLGEVLRGDRIENSLYTMAMRVDEPCKVGCGEFWGMS